MKQKKDALPAPLLAEFRSLRNRVAQLEVAESERQRADIVRRLTPKVFMEGADPIVIEDTDGNILDLNAEAERIYAWSRNELLGQPIKTLIPPERHGQADDLLAQCKRREVVRNVEGLRWNKDGERVPVLISLSLLTNEDGEPVAVATISKHIGDLKQVQDALRQTVAELDEAKNRYAAAVQASGQLLYDWDSNTDQALWDGPIEKVLDYKPHELGNTFSQWRDLIHADDMPVFDAAIQQLISSRATSHIEYRVRRKDGTYCYVEDRGQFFIDRTGSASRLVGFVSDITERKRAEEERQQLHQELVERERLAAIGTTAAKLAHEIGNPLNGMYMSAQLLEQHLAQQQELSELDPQLPQIARILSRETTRLNQILQEFRSLSRREKFLFQPIVLPSLITQTLATEALHCSANGVSVETEIPSDFPPVRADGDKLKQVLINVCKNAVEAMPDGGTLSIRASHNGGQAVIEIQDTGIGVPEDIDIFAPFATTKPHGTGLGLAVVQQIIAAHRGTLKYVSKAGRGTTFTLFLPLA